MKLRQIEIWTCLLKKCPIKFPFINQLVDYFEKDNEVYKENPKRIAY